METICFSQSISLMIIFHEGDFYEENLEELD